MLIQKLLEDYALDSNDAVKAAFAYNAMMKVTDNSLTLAENHKCCIEFIAKEINIPEDLAELLALSGDNIKHLLD